MWHLNQQELQSLFCCTLQWRDTMTPLAKAPVTSGSAPPTSHPMKEPHAIHFCGTYAGPSTSPTSLSPIQTHKAQSPTLTWSLPVGFSTLKPLHKHLASMSARSSARLTTSIHSSGSTQVVPQRTRPRSTNCAYLVSSSVSIATSHVRTTLRDPQI